MCKLQPKFTKESALNVSLILANANNKKTTSSLSSSRPNCYAQEANSTKCNCIFTVRVRYFYHNVRTVGLYAYVKPISERNVRSHLGEMVGLRQCGTLKVWLSFVCIDCHLGLLRLHHASPETTQ